jgi:hypothetical protein
MAWLRQGRREWRMGEWANGRMGDTAIRRYGDTAIEGHVPEAGQWFPIRFRCYGADPVSLRRRL